MKNYIPKTFRQILAMLLCVAMLLPMAVVPGYATEITEPVTEPTVAAQNQSEETVPETTAPEATVPETTVPETTAPETTVPETTVPETTAPAALDYGIAPILDEEKVYTVIAGSDFQNTSNDHNAGANMVTEFMNGFVNAKYTALDGFLFCGDYICSYFDKEEYSKPGKEALENAVWNVYGSRGLSKDAMVWVQGNHDPASMTTNGVLSPSGENDTEGYGVYVLHEKDYMWYDIMNEQTVKNTAAALKTYLEAKVAQKYTKPIFVVSHIPLHYSMRTSIHGDAMYANYIFDVLNQAGSDGLNIIFLFGHDHSNGWDDYLGGSAIYLTKGDSINIAQASKTKYAAKKLNFTYMNAGYVAYCTTPTAGAETDLTMTVFQITEDTVTVTRRTTNADHDLKSAGVKNTTKGDTFEPDTRVVASPQTITLNKTFRTTATSTETGVSVSGMGITGMKVEKVERDVPTGYSAYATYDITPTGYTGGDATVTIAVDDSFDASRPVTVIDVKTGETQTCNIVDGKVTFTATHFSLYTVAQTNASSAAFDGNCLIEVTDKAKLESGVPYVIADYRLNLVMTNGVATRNSDTGLLLSGEPDIDTEYKWYLDANGYVTYGPAENNQYLLVGTNANGNGVVSIGAYSESSAACLGGRYEQSGYYGFSVRSSDKANYLNRLGGGGATNNVASRYSSAGGSYWKFYKAENISVTINASSQTITEGGTSKLTPVVTVGGATAGSCEVSWSSGDTSIATVDESGVVTPVKQGTAIMTATVTKVDGACLGTPITAEIPVTVVYVHKTKDAVTAYTELGNVVIETPAAPVAGIPYVLVENVSGDALTGNMMYETSPGYAGLNIEGLELDADYLERNKFPVWYYEKGDGEAAYLRFNSLSASDNYLICNSSSQVTLGAKSETYVFNRIIPYGSDGTYNLQMYATGYYLNQLGGPGYNVAGPYSGAATSRWKFYEVIKDIAFCVSPNQDTIYPGETVTLTPTVKVNGSAVSSGNTIEWKSSNTAVATVSNGKVTAKSSGTAVITASLVAAKGADLGTAISVEIPITVIQTLTVNGTITSTVTIAKKLQPATLTLGTASGPYIITNVSSSRVLTGNLMTKDNPAYNGHNGVVSLELTDYNDFTELWYYDGQYLRYGSPDGTDNYLVLKNGMITLGTMEDTSAYDAVVDTKANTYGISAGAKSDSKVTSSVWLNQYGGDSFNVVALYSLKSDIKEEIAAHQGSCWYFNTVTDSREATISLTPASAKIYEGQSVNLTTKVTLDGVEQKNVVLRWTASDENVATVYEGKVSGVASGNVRIKAHARYIGGVKYDTEVSVASSIQVIGISKIALNSTSGSVAQRGSAKANTGATMTVTYDDGTTKEVPVTVDMLTDSNGKRVSTFNTNTYTDLNVTYGSHTVSGFTLNVVAPDKPDYPDYPAEGSVYVDKTGTGIDFQCSGTAQVELTAAGIPSKTGADVIIMLDTSSSMTNKIDTDTRLQVAAKSLNNLLDKLRAKDASGQTPDVRVAVAEFNTYFYQDWYSDSTYYLDLKDKLTNGSNPATAAYPRTPYVYTGSKALNADAFVDVQNVPYFTADNENGKIKLSYQTGTNYDYGFDTIYQLGDAITEANSTGAPRDLFVIFMSDGCPFQYNYIVGNSGNLSWNDYLTAKLSEDMIESHKDYYNKEGKNWMAEAIKGDPAKDYPVIRKNDPRDTDHDTWINLPGLGATMYVVGFCMKDDNQITVETMHTVNRNVASKPEYYYTANSADELNNAFNLITNEIQYAASEAYFLDEMGLDYDLLLGTQTYEDGSNVTQTIESVIEVRSYNVWTQQDADKNLCTANQVGNRKTDKDGNFVYTVLEKLTFSADGTKAYSNGGTENILKNGVICAKTFWYNTTSAAKDITLNTGKTYSLGGETFYWNLGTVSNAQLTLSYYVHLTNATSLRGETVVGKEAGIYNTNKHAELHYTNYLGKKECIQSVATPKLPWQQATVGYGFYLVDSNGNPIVNQSTGETGSFERAVKITQPVYQEFLLNSVGADIVAEIISGGDVLPDGYKLFDEGAEYEVQLNSNGTGYYIIYTDNKTGKQTTYVVGVTSTPVSNDPSKEYDNIVDKDGNEGTGQKVDTGSYTTANTVVWFGVVATVECVPDTVVIDFGLPVEIDVIANDIMMGDHGELKYIGKTDVFATGYAAAKEAAKQAAEEAEKEYVEMKMWEYLQTIKGDQEADVAAETLEGTYGKLEVLKNEKAETTGELRYTLNDAKAVADAAEKGETIINGMQMKEEETFVYAVNYTGDVGVKGYYYSTVTVIPATTIYYEDSFVTFKVKNYEDAAVLTDAKYKDLQWSDAGETKSGTQAEDRPGEFSLSGLDANNIYGYDAAYKNMTEYSMGSAKKVTVGKHTVGEGEAAEEITTYGTAEFTFWGTGFDVISLTSAKTGTILVKVRGVEGGAVGVSQNFMVDTYYGYQREFHKVTYTYRDSKWEATEDVVITEEAMGTSKKVPEDPKVGDQYVAYETRWVVDTSATENNALYQIPVMKVEDLPYGKYNVTISASHKDLYDHSQYETNDKYDFYLDAIRIYDPANDGANSDVIKDAYVADGEGWPEYFELRDLLISSNDFDALAEDQQTSGIVFIDNTKEPAGKSYTVTDYKNYGPNNELYLAPGQAVVFNLDVPAEKLANIHLALKGVGKNVQAKVHNARVETSKVPYSKVGTATDLYYDITQLNGKTVIISNSEGSEGILSITNIKVTYKTAPSSNQGEIEDSFFTTTRKGVKLALLSLRAPVVEKPEETVPETTAPEETVPETTVPETTVPEETVPETTIPEETVPETTVPETTAPAEPEVPETFEPQKFNVQLSASSVKVGSNVIVTVTTGTDVDHITVNSEEVSRYTANRWAKTRTWQVKVKAETAGAQAVEVICYNAEDLASAPVVKTVTVTQQYTSVTNWLTDVVTGIVSSLLSKWR